MSRPLEHIKVIDVTRTCAGPTCVRQLGDMGAQVIKVEAIEDDDISARDGWD